MTINMCQNKNNNAFHNKICINTHSFLFKKELSRLIKHAIKHGKCWKDIQNGPVKDYIKRKSYYKSVKYYCGHVFIFQQSSTTLITMYPIPEEILLAQKEYDEQK